MKQEVILIPPDDIVVREDLYPRKSVDPGVVFSYQGDSLQTILESSPIEINQNNILIDGQHRLKAARLNDWTEVPVVITSTDSDRELLLLAIERNRAHGKRLTTTDKRVCAVKLYSEMVTPETVTKAHTAAIIELAGILSVARRTVNNYVEGTCLELKDKRDEGVLADRSDEVPVTTTLTKYGISAGTYHRIVKEDAAKDMRARQQRDWQMGVDARSGMSQELIAKKHGVSQSRVSEIIGKLSGSMDASTEDAGRSGGEPDDTIGGLFDELESRNSESQEPDVAPVEQAEQLNIDLPDEPEAPRAGDRLTGAESLWAKAGALDQSADRNRAIVRSYERYRVRKLAYHNTGYDEIQRITGVPMAEIIELVQNAPEVGADGPVAPCSVEAYDLARKQLGLARVFRTEAENLLWGQPTGTTDAVPDSTGQSELTDVAGKSVDAQQPAPDVGPGVSLLSQKLDDESTASTIVGMLDDPCWMLEHIRKTYRVTKSRVVLGLVEMLQGFRGL